MAEIRVLSSSVADKIAAGEVVERPAAAVKELIENSIDAGADRIRVEIKNGGIKYISVEDNGKGILGDEIESAFLRHATSKLREIEDLSEIMTMGFRGEALASICAVSEVRAVSRTKEDDEGTAVVIKHGKTVEKSSVVCNFGTTMIIENLFANVPARMKFLKKDSTEAGYVTDVVGRIALANPNVAIKYISDDKEIFSTSGDGRLENVILNIYGIDHAKAVMKVDYNQHGVRVHGVIGKAEIARGNRTRQTLLVNGRYIKSHVVAKVVEEAYRNVLMTGKFPFFVLNIDLAPSLVDVNVHPAKTEIKFANEKEIYNIVHFGIKNALYAVNEESVPKKAEPFSAKTDNDFRNETKKTVDASRNFGVEKETPDKKLIKEFIQNTVPEKENPSRIMSFCAPENDREAYWNKKEPVFEKEDFENSIRAKTLSREIVLAEEPKAAFEEKAEKAFDKDLFGREILPESAEEENAVQKVLGQVFDTYVIVQQGDKMYLIDQHAAHERKRFEMLKEDFTQKKKCGQVLLSPIVLEVDSLELQAVRDNSELLLNMGFLMEEFGRNTVIIRETPLVGDEAEIKSLALEIISVLLDGRPIGMLSFEERLLDMISCKYAIKANKQLSVIEMEGLLKDVSELEKRGITTCPHGRPIRVVITKREIEKMFKRIV